MAAFSSRQYHNLSRAHTIQLKPKPSRKGKAKERTPESAHTNRDSRTSVDQGLSWDWINLTDPSASKVAPVFTKDGSYFFSLVGCAVKVHSTDTGEVVSTLATPSRSPAAQPSVLTSIILNPNNPFQIITGSVDGHLLLWDFLEATLLRTIDVTQPIYHICAHKDIKDSVFVAVTRPAKVKGPIDDNGVVLRISLTVQPSSEKPTSIIAVGKTRFPAGLTISPSGAWLVAIAGHKVYVATVNNLKAGFIKFVSPERLTCLAFHPFEGYFATGDVKGCVRLWYCLNDQKPAKVPGVERKSATTTLHWHAHAVSTIAFTRNGAYLLSGGEEAVLVIWQLHTGRKEFVPRVGAPISTIALWKNGEVEEYMLGLADATYLFVSSASLKVTKCISRIKLDPAVVTRSPISKPPLALHSSTSTIIIPSSHPSFLQIYSPGSLELVSEIEISPTNRVSRRDEVPIEPTRVLFATTSLDGQWMATIDFRDGQGDFRDEIYLKFWAWNALASQWSLNTRIDRPHGLEQVNLILFKPNTKTSKNHQCVSIGGDGQLKIWRLRPGDGKGSDFWVSKSFFEFRDHIPSGLSWSADGSLLAVATGSQVALLDPNSNKCIWTLPSPEDENLILAQFVGPSGQYLAVATESHLNLWDVVRQSVRWTHTASVPISSIFTTKDTNLITVFHSSPAGATATPITTFQLSSSVPFTKSNVPFQLRNFCHYFSGSQQFIGITQDWRTVLFGEKISRPTDEGSAAKDLSSHQIQTRRSLLCDIFGSSAFTDLEILNVPIFHTKPVRQGDYIGHIFDAPAYLLPSLEMLYGSLIDNFLQKQPSGTNHPPIESEVSRAEEDVTMEEVSVTATPTRSQLCVIEPDELQSLTELFKEHCLKPPQIPGPVKSNGVSLTPKNIISHQAHQNGKSNIKSKPLSGTETQQVKHSPPSTTNMVNGKKRKKS